MATIEVLGYEPGKLCTVSFICSECQKHVSKDDTKCWNCRADLNPSDLLEYLHRQQDPTCHALNKELKESPRWDDDFPRKKIYRNLCPYCGHQFNAVNSENYCPNCGRGDVD